VTGSAGTVEAPLPTPPRAPDLALATLRSWMIDLQTSLRGVAVLDACNVVAVERLAQGVIAAAFSHRFRNWIQVSAGKKVTVPGLDSTLASYKSIACNLTAYLDMGNLLDDATLKQADISMPRLFALGKALVYLSFYLQGVVSVTKTRTGKLAIEPSTAAGEVQPECCMQYRMAPWAAIPGFRLSWLMSQVQTTGTSAECDAHNLALLAYVERCASQLVPMPAQVDMRAALATVASRSPQRVKALETDARSNRKQTGKKTAAAVRVVGQGDAAKAKDSSRRLRGQRHSSEDIGCGRDETLPAPQARRASQSGKLAPPTHTGLPG
jgi:hypothetical protein